ncbi:cbb3-type cytochrome c oxidase N-terminal domain-containing protein [Sphingobacterium sp. HJSM2_6]|uniref:cbb3-type cytochrome c oxidase N-terminal domain-containing protein n=1 Tax=Sphingobacterium sp. HJSM2_6 TaxID=3366264 RepID=UPI003BE8DF4E
MNIILLADVAATSAKPLGTGNLYNDIFYISVFLVLLAVLFAALAINKALRSMLKVTMPEVVKEEKRLLEEKKIARRTYWKKTWDYITGLKPLAEEKSLVIEDHEYDGIEELNNPIPVWFSALFYSSIVFAIVYILIYHVLGIGLNQDQEYEREMALAEKAKQEYLSKSANLFDENTITVDASGSLAANGKGIFVSNCAACHGNDGEGTIGPNLADRYWIHGGEIKDIFRTIKYGVPDKGMVPWEQTLTPAQIAEVSNYILTLRDTKPTNPKEPQGEEILTYENESGAAEQTNVGSGTDSVTVENK